MIVKREFTMQQIRARFPLAAIGGSPAIGREAWAGGKDGWYIRVSVSVTIGLTSTRERYDYFRLSPDGTILSAPRGYNRDYRPGRVVDIETAGGAS